MIQVTSRSTRSRAVHHRQLAQPGRSERNVEGEAAGGHRLDDLVVAQDDQRAGAAAEDALETVAQRVPGAMVARVARRRSVSSERSVATCVVLPGVCGVRRPLPEIRLEAVLRGVFDGPWALRALGLEHLEEP